MNNPILNNDNFISVVPRIIDPEMKFTTKSIQNLNNANGKHNKVPNKQVPQQAMKNTKDIPVPTVSFYNNYKYIIIIGLIVIGLIVIILLIYYLYKKNKDKQTKIHNKDSIEKDNQDVKKLTDNVSSGGACDTEKKKNIDKYISNYILNDDDSDSEGEDDEQASTKDELNTTANVESTMETQSPETDENMTDNNIIHQKMQEQRMQQQYIQQQQMQQFQQLQQMQHFQQMQSPQVVNIMDTNNLSNNLNLHNTQMPNMMVSGIMEVNIEDNTDNIILPNDNIIEELTSEVDYDIDDFLNTNETLNTDIISNDETTEDEIVIINESDDDVEIKTESTPDTISESNNKNIDIIMKSDAAKKTYNKNKKKSVVSTDDELNYFKKFVK